jgi:GNAT superfamily N-acetyltransferase
VSVLRFVLREATAADAEAVADVFIASRRRHVACAPLAHGEADVRRWIAQQLLPGGGVCVACDADSGRVLGFSAVSQAEGVGWIDQLYLEPGLVGRGIGTRLLERALRGLARPVRLYTFQANTGARRFYERHGFVVIALGDGSGNEEGCPDALYERVR